MNPRERAIQRTSELLEAHGQHLIEGVRQFAEQTIEVSRSKQQALLSQPGRSPQHQANLETFAANLGEDLEKSIRNMTEAGIAGIRKAKVDFDRHFNPGR